MISTADDAIIKPNTANKFAPALTPVTSGFLSVYVAQTNPPSAIIKPIITHMSEPTTALLLSCGILIFFDLLFFTISILYQTYINKSAGMVKYFVRVGLEKTMQKTSAKKMRKKTARIVLKNRMMGYGKKNQCVLLVGWLEYFQ